MFSAITGDLSSWSAFAITPVMRTDYSDCMTYLLVAAAVVFSIGVTRSAMSFAISP